MSVHPLPAASKRWGKGSCRGTRDQPPRLRGGGTSVRQESDKNVMNSYSDKNVMNSYSDKNVIMPRRQYRPELSGKYFKRVSLSSHQYREVSNIPAVLPYYFSGRQDELF